MQSVLVVDDERTIREGLTVMIERLRPDLKRVVAVADGEAALARLQTTQFDLVITDIRMPRMDGLELMRRSRAVTMPPLFWVLSGYNEFSYAQKAIQLGARGYLLKPVDRKELREALEQAEQLSADQRRNRQARIQQLLDTPEITKQLERQILDSIGFDSSVADNRIAVLAFDHLVRQQPRLVERALMAAGAFVRDAEQLVPLTDGSERGLVFAIGPDGTTAELEQLVLETGAVIGTGKCAVGVDGSYRSRSDVVLRQKLRKARRAITRRMQLPNSSAVFVASDAEAPVPGSDVDRIVRETINLIGTGQSGVIGDRLQSLEHVGTTQKELELNLEILASSVLRTILLPFEETIRRDGQLSEISGRLRDFTGYGAYADLHVDLTDLICRLDQEAATAGQSVRGDQKLEDTITWIGRAYSDKNLSMAMAAEHADMGYSYFSKRFSEVTGQSFVSYVKSLRVEKGKRLLESTDLKVGQIADMVGFSSRKKFSKAFQNQEGSTPMEYRERARITGR